MSDTDPFGWIRDLPLALDPIYPHPEISQPIPLYEGDLELFQGDLRIVGCGAVRLNWLPSPTFGFELHPSEPGARPDFHTATTLYLTADGRTLEVRPHTIHSTEAGIDLISGRVKNPPAHGVGRITSMVFHLPNFCECPGPAVRSDDGHHSWLGRSVMEAEEWRITLDTLPNTRGSRDRSEDLRGYLITHVGKLERVDGATFKADDAAEIQKALAYFLSFCRGAWTRPILSVGFDDHGRRVWEDLSVGKVTPSRRPHSWVDSQTDPGLEGAFPGFMEWWGDETWREPLELALHWYMEGNLQSGAIEGSIVLIQAAFELLAWTLLVEDRKFLSQDSFKPGKLFASDKIRLLISHCGIPLEIPNQFAALKALPLGAEKKDGPGSFTEIRNAYVHPDPKKRQKLAQAGLRARYEAWKLGMWYLELVLLRLFGYEGSYVNRLSLSDLREDVPWITGGDW